MRVAVRSLGRLQSAEIDLDRDLILFTGPNNTSKTYVAYLIYGLASGDWFLIDPSADARPLFERLHDELGQHGSCSFEIQDLLDLLPGYLRLLGGHGAEMARSLFATGADSFQEVDIQITPAEQDVRRSAQALLQAQFHDVYSEIVLTKEAGSSSYDLLYVGKEPPEKGAVVDDLGKLLSRHLGEAARSLFPPGVILPAERSAIQLFSQELTIGRAEAADAGEPRSGVGRKVRELRRQARRYPLPIRDCLRIASDLATLQKRDSPFAPLADRLERDVLQGTVRATEHGEIVYTPAGAEAPIGLHVSSSSVKALSLLSFYLRHILDPGDLLVIDEPELNLHPDNQRLVARVLARVARSGARVLVSTHSDYFIREINNLIMLAGDADGELRDSLGYAADEVLEPARVGAWLFLPDHAEAIPVTETGFAVRTIDREINRLNNDSEKIYLSLFGDRP